MLVTEHNQSKVAEARAFQPLADGIASELRQVVLGHPGQIRAQRVPQNEAPATEFIAARWHFGTNGMIGHMGWSHNYPNSDINLNEFLERATLLDLDRMLDPGQRERAVANLRRYAQEFRSLAGPAP